jgi:hydrogenase maturation factor
LAWLLAFVPVQAGVPDPGAPAMFLPGGILGVQIGGSWGAARRNPALHVNRCQAYGQQPDIFDEVCFFTTTRRLSGAQLQDGFIVRHGDRVVLIGTGVAIRNVDDPRAEAVMRYLQNLVHARFRQTGDDVLFVNLPNQRLSREEMAGFARTAPVLLVELQPEETELAVYYGYLAPVNAFSALAAD